MYRLNLPSYNIKISGTANRPSIWDRLRKRYVSLTPEEWVRQHFINYLIDFKKYPEAFLTNEVSLQLGNKMFRADSVLYDRDLKPRMIVEYKSPTIRLTQKVFDQITRYNMLLHVEYLIVSNGLQHYCCKIDYSSNRYIFLQDIPFYRDL